MFDLGMGELLLIGIVALIVVGPKDLPVMFRTVGRFTGKMKAMARDFQRAMNEAADDTGMREIDRDLRKMTSARKLGLDKLDEASKAFAKWDPMGDAAVAKRAGAPAPATSPEARGPATAALAEERAEAARRVREAAAETAARRAAEASEEPDPDEAPAAPPEPARAAGGGA